MDELDRNLLEAWGRVVGRLRGDVVEARKRWRRSRGKELGRPMRDWCLSLRASDTRLSEWNAIFSDGNVLGRVEDRVGHRVEIDGRTLKELCAPVRIPWPGVELRVAAAALGRHKEGLRHWMPRAARPGRTRGVRAHKAPRRYEEIIEPGCVFSVRYEAARSHGHQGVDVPVVWAERALNPGAVRGQRPHALWGSVWEGMQDCVPDDYVVELERLPRFRPYTDRRTGWQEERWRGWDVVCPGRFDPATGGHRACGRRVQTLYLPLPVFTIGRYLGGEEGIEIGVGGELGLDCGREISKSAKPQAAGEEDGGLRLSGRWYPGVEDAWAGRRSFACSRCWAVRNFTISDYRGWNAFVSHISGGLLFGKEVKKPGWLRYERKQVQVRRKGEAGGEDEGGTLGGKVVGL